MNLEYIFAPVLVYLFIDFPWATAWGFLFYICKTKRNYD